jgi:hypothetical protein
MADYAIFFSDFGTQIAKATSKCEPAVALSAARSDNGDVYLVGRNEAGGKDPAVRKDMLLGG